MAVNVDLARRSRRWHDLTQAAVAEEVGVHEQTLAAWERGEYEPPVEQKLAWAKAISLAPIRLDPALEQFARELLAPATEPNGDTQPVGRAVS
jgi:DNA-binding XRE family transcriptional regulator